jgi:hypothetical protein
MTECARDAHLNRLLHSSTDHYTNKVLTHPSCSKLTVHFPKSNKRDEQQKWLEKMKFERKARRLFWPQQYKNILPRDTMMPILRVCK